MARFARPAPWLAVALLAAATGALVWSVGAPEPGSRAGGAPGEGEPAPERLAVRVVRSLPHDRGAFTQGLLFHAGQLWESTGQYGRSRVRRIDPADGTVLAERPLPPGYFGEGLARVGEHLVQLTWREGTAFRWTLPGLEPAGELTYTGEGWGLCFDGEHLVMSDGTSQLSFRDPESFEVVGRIGVRAGDHPLADLNELECARGAVYANLWMTERIVRIDPGSGRVTADIDASGLLTPRERQGTDVMNGIAYRPGTETFFLTGKHWPKLFEVELVPAP